MKHALPFFNWSLAKVLATEPDSLKKARISIVFVVILLNLIKTLVALPVGLYNNQGFQLIRIVIFFLVMCILLKFLLIDRRYSGIIGVIIIWFGLLLTWTNVFIIVQEINIVTMQVIVTVILSSFYLLTWRWALFYSLLSILPVVVLFIGPDFTLTTIVPDQLASPGYEIILILNFLTIIIAHFLYYQALNKNMLEKELLNKQLQQAVHEANIAVQSKADFLSTMSHELRTPLNSVIGMTQLLLSSPYSEEQAENLKVVNFSAMNLHMLINDILDFNKMESDKLKLETISVDLYALVKDICLAMRFQADDKGLQLIPDIDDRIQSTFVLTDPTRLTQIIHNLLSNAIKFTPSGGYISLDLKVKESYPDSLAINFSVRDTGIGISIEQQELIFEAFTQASSSTTRNFGGTGLGLTIVKRLLKLFNSNIQVQSTEGEGSEFFFDITFKTVDREEENLTLNTETIYDLNELRVMVVEDNPINSLLIKKIFLNWNSTPVFASNGYEAIEKLQQDYYDVILMDIHMPLLDGYETVKLIRKMSDKAKSTVRVIALTASVSDDLHAKVTAAGMNDYIHKPFNSDDLYRRLRALDPTARLLSLNDSTDSMVS